ncbi:hypothetical protein [Pseudomonas sp. NFACC07-1]|uniref:hypothetical protein n=1 Tax=Pseudomonas sp. NFACC07-1 TaxID=1566239 RepID=UPI0008BEDCCB|nr:hypothetical protein [Pseudomonas sp. NFACC07-1]SEI69654.1 hypothetical protein SAMN03159298_01091 [Pseudomonas sp. NFACC07-1]
MTDVQALKDEALDQYEKQGKYEVIYTNFHVDMFRRYDELTSQGYKRAADSYITASNMNWSVVQVVHMEKPAKLQEQELKAIYAAIDAAQ